MHETDGYLIMYASKTVSTFMVHPPPLSSRASLDFFVFLYPFPLAVVREHLPHSITHQFHAFLFFFFFPDKTNAYVNVFDYSQSKNCLEATSLEYLLMVEPPFPSYDLIGS